LTIENAIDLHLRNIEGGMGRMAVLISAEAKHQNAKWPFVTMPSFEVIGSSVRAQTGMEVIVFCPFVTAGQVQEWQEFSLANAQTWLKESRDVAQSLAEKSNASGVYTSFVATDYVNGGPSPVLLDMTADLLHLGGNESLQLVPSVQRRPGGPYLPVWMHTPPPFNPNLINVDFFSAGAPFPFVSAVLAARRPLLSKAYDMSALATLSIKYEDHERFHASLVKYKSNATTSTFQHPHCPYMYPVFEKPGDASSNIVAILTGLLPMDRYLINLLPEGVNGIDAVLENRNQSFTYRLDGSSVGIENIQSSKVDAVILTVPIACLARRHRHTTLDRRTFMIQGSTQRFGESPFSLTETKQSVLIRATKSTPYRFTQLLNSSHDISQKRHGSPVSGSRLHFSWLFFACLHIRHLFVREMAK
jgi:hypothetical protein